MCKFRWIGWSMLALAGGCAGPNDGPETRPVGRPVLSAADLEETRTKADFEQHVKPILEVRCLHCHRGTDAAAGFNMETREGAMASGPRGPRIVPGHPDGSLFVGVVSTGNHGLSMPTVGMKMPAEEVEVLKRWIAQGADWPSGSVGRLRERE